MSTTFDASADSGADPSTSAPSASLAGDAPTAPLGCFAPGGHLEGHPALTSAGSGVVVLGYSPDDPEIVDVHADHGAYPLPADTPVTTITDQARCADLLRRTVVHLTDRLREARSDLRSIQARHARTLQEIRRYAIDQHLDDQYCRDGLNTFLQTFGMPIYAPRIRVSYTITGSYQVEGDDTYSATHDATGYLTVDHSQVDGMLEGTDSFTVDVNQATALDT